MAGEVNPFGPVDVVLVGRGQRDPAIDASVSEETVDRYDDTHDLSLLQPFRDGLRPTLFHLEPIPQLYAHGKLSDLPTYEKLQTAALVAIRAVTTPDGQVHRVEEKDLLMVAVGVRRVPDAFGARIIKRYGPSALLELGAVAIRRASVTDDAAAF